MIQNLSGRDVILESNTEVGMATTANIVPSIQIPSNQDLSENEKVQCKSAQTDLSEEIQQEETDILQKVDLSGIADWDPKIQQEAQDLICQYACIFSQNILDLGNTSIIKHSVKLTNPSPFEEHYRCIPARMYDEVRMHVQ